MLSIDELLLQIAILAEICIKMKYFYWKNCKKSPRVGGFAPRPPCLRQLGAPPQDLQSLIENSWLRHCYTPFF